MPVLYEKKHYDILFDGHIEKHYEMLLVKLSFYQLSTKRWGLKTKAFFVIKERVERKIQRWKEKLLSQVGRDILLKVIAQSIPTIAMSGFLLSNGFFIYCLLFIFKLI